MTSSVDIIGRRHQLALPVNVTMGVISEGRGEGEKVPSFQDSAGSFTAHVTNKVG